MAPTHSSDPDRREVTLYCRASTATASAIDRYHTELSRLSKAGVIDDLEVVTWPNRVELSSTGECRIATAYDEFTEWAERKDCRLSPAFDVESYESEFTGESGTALVTPVACVATRENGELTVVYPHVEDGDVVTVEDGIDLLANADGATAGTTSGDVATRSQE